MNGFWNKIRRKWMKLWWQPIRVYCLHHVCAEFDKDSMYACDWMQIDEFKNKVLAMQHDGVEFISLTEAYEHLKNDKIRKTKYAVLTFDDGYASMKEVLPWLGEQKIPATLFINGKYLDGKSYRENSKEQYLIYDELFKLTSPLIEIGSHGWEHKDACKMFLYDFEASVIRNHKLLQTHPRYIPFYAYTYGSHIPQEDEFLKSKSIVPVLISGEKNYSNLNYIDRELITK